MADEADTARYCLPSSLTAVAVTVVVVVVAEIAAVVGDVD